MWFGHVLEFSVVRLTGRCRATCGVTRLTLGFVRTWLLRGAVLAVVHAAAQTITAKYTVTHPTSGTTVQALVLGVLVAVAAVWAAVDTWREVYDRGRAWLIASLIAGWGAGVLGVIGKAIFVDQTNASELGDALTGGAAFTALLVLMPAGLGLLVGKTIARPTVGKQPTGRHASTPKPRPRPAQPSEEPADT
jgi:hypothetical protein